MATVMVEGDATERAAVMVGGNRNGNGQREWQWAMATTMVMDLESTTEMATAIAMAMATARVTRMLKAGLPLHVSAMGSAMAGGTPCLHPHRSAFISAALLG
jgi:hypothetical protein